jgi:hypothetical protein
MLTKFPVTIIDTHTTQENSMLQRLRITTGTEAGCSGNFYSHAPWSNIN